MLPSSEAELGGSACSPVRASLDLRALGGLSLALAAFLAPLHALEVETLRAVGGLPPHIAGTYEEAIGFEQSQDGTYYVFDRRGHAVHVVDRNRTSTRKLLDIGQEAGRIIQPAGFDVAADGRLVVTDVPRSQQRIQTFDAAGTRLSGFTLPGEPASRIVFGGLMLNAAATVQLAGRSLLLSHPESGALFTEYSTQGYSVRSIGQLRPTGFEADHDIHVAMNAGLPLVDPTGGYYYVFVTGRPVLRKYDAHGEVVFERLIQGREMDSLLAVQPTEWPRRRVQDRVVPVVTPIIRAAAVNRKGELWISLAVPFTYVFDSSGDKIRTVQFVGGGLVSPTSLSFAPSGRLLVTPGCYEFDI
jgi:DNA-binding beta-propeller fold protein YncE